MERTNVSLTVEAGLCISCGMCKGVCPKSCIEWKRKKGMYYPFIDEKKCISCGICYEVCPGIQVSWEDVNDDLIETTMGKFVRTYNAWSLNKDIRHVSASGGIVSSLVDFLLAKGYYQTVFCVDTYNYDELLVSNQIVKEKIEKKIENTSLPKSRYLPVSQEKAAKFMLSNRNEKIIFIATPCAVQGFNKLIERFGLDRSNYLIIGLFCERVFNYNVNQYFRQNKFCDGKEISQFHFKNKESGGWPGNMKLFFEDGSTKYVKNTERMKIKDYFMPERCLYCIDKLNVGADISLGDNYTEILSSKFGSNSVIIRTKQGEDIWKICGFLFDSIEIDIKSIVNAQDINGRIRNFYYSNLKEKNIFKETGEEIVINSGINNNPSPKYLIEYNKKLKKIRFGENFEKNPEKLIREIKIEENTILRKKRFDNSILIRGINYLKRQLRG